MTDDRRPTDDPTRALDGVNPPDQWDDITARAAGAGPSDLMPVATSSLTRRPYLFAAAAVLAVLAIAAGLVVTQRDEGSDQVVAGPSASAGSDDPADAFGRRWLLEQFLQNGEILEIDASGRSSLLLDLTVDGAVSFRRCSGGPASITLDGDRLLVGHEWMSTTEPCPGPEGAALMAVDDAMADLLFDRPFVELAGDRLVLRSGTAEAHFQEAIGEPIRTDGDDDDAGVAQSGDATCGIGLSPSVDSRATEPLENGPADPPVVHTGWAPDEASGQGVWNVVHGDQRVEIHVPGLMVDDLLGERTEEVLLGDMWAATVWFTDEWVQVRHFGDGFEGSCTSFTITATGSTEEANRDTAMAIASSLRTWECPCPEDSSEPLAPESGTQPEPTIPSADDGEDIDLRGWYGNTGPMVLAAVEVDDVVTPAVDTPFGGGMADTDGGPIALVARVDEGGLELRGCEVVALSLDEHDGRPSVGLLSGSYSSEGCAPDAGEQWGQVLTILSLGPVTRTVETDDGPMLALSTDEGTALFHRFPPR